MVYSVFYTPRQGLKMGRLMLTSDGENLTGLWFEGQKYFAHGLTEELRSGRVTENADLPLFSTVKSWLDSYFAGDRPALYELSHNSKLSLNPQGTEFRRAVWDILCGIAYGETTTYGEIAHVLASRMNREHMSSQAVGGAVGHNPISIIIPCHRVIGKDGSLTGYAGGLDKKIQLLEHEGVNTSVLSGQGKT
ncbi:MAG: methylated-DNA--[protein]-cysteine S-methyltransferase [Spirochaetaceae bacterium]|jgi:methylated-DNA-[protein]-cysteine S-methyltransferase|nr:methylated-DNA--[protein]-cysteine S-methyltransferase [Spirochaetaceae bacterium]